MISELTLERMVHGGRALGRLEDGRVVLVRGGIPGERVRAELSTGTGVALGDVVEVLEGSTDRVDSPAHPGLDLGFVAYDRQLSLKREVVVDALRRRPNAAEKAPVEVPDVVRSPGEWGYRNVVQPAAVGVGGSGGGVGDPVRATQPGLGYRKPDSEEVVVMETDPAAHRAIQRVWKVWPTLDVPGGVKEVILRATTSGKVLVTLVASGDMGMYRRFADALHGHGVAGVSYAGVDPRGRLRSGHTPLLGETFLLERFGEFQVPVSSNGFAQPNVAAASELYSTLGGWFSSGDGSRACAVDLYAGGGVIGLHLASVFQEVIAVELDRALVQQGKETAVRAGVPNVLFLRSDACRYRFPPTVNLVVVDPPRRGLDRKTRGNIQKSSASGLVYVSCDVATWCRDVAYFESQGWTLQKVQPHDFFPHTHHVELLSMLVRS